MVGREPGRGICSGLVELEPPGAERGWEYDVLEFEGERRRVGNGGARDIGDGIEGKAMARLMDEV